LWEIGEVYEGDIPPNKHFSADGISTSKAPPSAVDDPRSTKELKENLIAVGMDVPEDWNRKKIWQKHKEMEDSMLKDELTNPSQETTKPKRGKPKAE
jgi:hypothetical protein